MQRLTASCVTRSAGYAAVCAVRRQQRLNQFPGQLLKLAGLSFSPDQSRSVMLVCLSTLADCKQIARARTKKRAHASIAVSGALVKPCESLLYRTVASGIAARAAAALQHC